MRLTLSPARCSTIVEKNRSDPDFVSFIREVLGSRLDMRQRGSRLGGPSAPIQVALPPLLQVGNRLADRWVRDATRPPHPCSSVWRWPSVSHAFVTPESPRSPSIDLSSHDLTTSPASACAQPLTPPAMNAGTAWKTFMRSNESVPNSIGKRLVAGGCQVC